MIFFKKSKNNVEIIRFLFIMNPSCYDAFTPGRGVTANMPLLGRGDSGFESRRSDQIRLRQCKKIVCIGESMRD